GRTGAIAPREIASLQDRRAYRLEEARRYELPLRAHRQRPVETRRLHVDLRDKGRVEIPGEVVRKRDRPDAWKRGEVFDERRIVRLLVIDPGRAGKLPCASEHEPVGSESEVERPEANERAHEECSGEHQHDEATDLQ